MIMNKLSKDMKLWLVTWKRKGFGSNTVMYSDKKRMIKELYSTILYHKDAKARGIRYSSVSFSVEEFDIVRNRAVLEDELDKEFQIEGI